MARWASGGGGDGGPLAGWWVCPSLGFPRSRVWFPVGVVEAQAATRHGISPTELCRALLVFRSDAGVEFAGVGLPLWSPCTGVTRQCFFTFVCGEVKSKPVF